MSAPTRRAASLIFVLALALGCERVDERPDILLITLDTTRADHLGVYGYPRETSPQLDAFAAGALVFDRAVSSGTWTLPAHASLFTGKLPKSHGAQFDPKGGLRLGQVLSGESFRQIRARTLSEGERTLASVLRDAGYATGAVVAGPWMVRQFGLDAGFDSYDDEGIRTLGGRWGKSVTQRALAWLDETPRRPRFLFLNYFDAHGPFDPPDAYLQLLAGDAPPLPPEAPPGKIPPGTVDRYDAELRYQDAALGALFDGLRERGLFEQTWIWVTADHGELFGEHGESGHGDMPYEAVVRVPLLMKESGAEPPTGRVASRVQITDVMPTILSGLGLPVPEEIPGRRLFGSERPIVVESRTLPAMHHRGSWRALYEKDWKLVWSSAGDHLLFDLATDPEEKHNLVDRRDEIAKRMLERLERLLAALPPPGPPPAPLEVDAETREALRAVGYLDD